jgi:hypothetical protein
VKFPKQPGAGKLPSTINAPGRDSQRFRRLIDAQAREEPQSHDVADRRFLLLQATKGFIERQNFFRILRVGQIQNIEEDSRSCSAAFFPLSRALFDYSVREAS